MYIFICVFRLHVSLFAHYICPWCWRKPEKSIRFPRIGVINGLWPVREIDPGSSGRAATEPNHWASLQPTFLSIQSFVIAMKLLGWSQICALAQAPKAPKVRGLRQEDLEFKVTLGYRDSGQLEARVTHTWEREREYNLNTTYKFSQSTYIYTPYARS